MLTQRQVGGLGLGVGPWSGGSRVSVWGESRGPGMHLWNGPGSSGVGEGRRASLGGHTDHPDSRWDVLEGRKGGGSG